MMPNAEHGDTENTEPEQGEKGIHMKVVAAATTIEIGYMWGK